MAIKHIRFPSQRAAKKCTLAAPLLHLYLLVVILTPKQLGWGKALSTGTGTFRGMGPQCVLGPSC